MRFLLLALDAPRCGNGSSLPRTVREEFSYFLESTSTASYQSKILGGGTGGWYSLADFIGPTEISIDRWGVGMV